MPFDAGPDDNGGGEDEPHICPLCFGPVHRVHHKFRQLNGHSAEWIRVCCAWVTMSGVPCRWGGWDGPVTQRGMQ